VRTVLLTSLLLTSVLLVMLAHAEDVATLEYEQPLPPNNERPRSDKGKFDGRLLHFVLTLPRQAIVWDFGGFSIVYENDML